jgi:hypothetical protein
MSKTSASTHIKMPPVEPIEGRDFQLNSLLPTMDFKKLSEISSFLVSWKPTMLAWVLLNKSIGAEFLSGLDIPWIPKENIHIDNFFMGCLPRLFFYQLGTIPQMSSLSVHV